MTDEMLAWSTGGMILPGKPKYILFTAHPTWTGMESNKGLRGERPATNHLGK
jgi:hypothetical protein